MKQIILSFTLIVLFLSQSAFAAKGIIIGGTTSGGRFVIAEEGNGIAIDESGVHFAAEQNLRFSVEAKNYKVALSPKTGLTGFFKQQDLSIEINDAVRKIELQVDGYRLYIALPGIRITVSNDNVVEIAIDASGVRFLENSDLKMAITEQGMPKRDPKKKSHLSLYADNTGGFEIAIKEQGVR